MTYPLATSIVVLALAWLAVGVTFALGFLAWGVHRVDPAARAAGWGFRLVILPGVAAFWPLFAWRWWRGVREPPEERTAHRAAARRAGP